MAVVRRRSMRLTHWTAPFALMLLCGCAGNGPAPTSTDNLFDQLQANIFDPNCLGAGCHNSQARAGGMDLSPGASYASLVNAVPNNPVAQSDGLLRVQPFNPGNSFLIVKLTGPGDGEGARMPQGMDSLAASDIESLRNWILAGAPRTGTAPPTGQVTPLPTDTAEPSPTTTATVTLAVPTATATITSTPPATGTPTATVTGSAPPTSTATVTPTVTPTESASPSPSPTPTLSQFGVIQTTIFNTTCIGAFCHDSLTSSGGLVLVEGQSYSSLVGATPQNAAAIAAGYLRVDAGNPDNSFILVKLDTPALPFGNRMPLGKPPLSAEQIQLIHDWIAAGAPQ